MTSIIRVIMDRIVNLITNAVVDKYGSLVEFARTAFIEDRDFVNAVAEDEDLATNVAAIVRLDSVASSIDLSDLAGEIDLSDLAEAVDTWTLAESVAENVDEEAIAEHIDLNELAGCIDLTALAGHVATLVPAPAAPEPVVQPTVEVGEATATAVVDATVKAILARMEEMAASGELR